MLRRLWEKTKLLWKLATTERATPREIFWSVFIGAFVGCSPAMGFHGIVAMAVATVFKKNRLFAWLGARLSNVVTLPFFVVLEVQIAHRLRTGAYLPLEVAQMRTILEDRPFELLLDWLLGMIPVGTAAGIVCGGFAYLLAWMRDRRKARRAADPAT